MWALGVVACEPLGGHPANLAARVEHIAIEYVGVVGAVEPLDVGVLSRLAGRDESEVHTVFVDPLRKLGTYQLWAIVEPQPARLAADLESGSRD